MPLNWIQFATLWRQEHLLKLIVEYLLHHFCLVNLQIIHHNQAQVSQTFFLKLNDEWKESVCVICLSKSMSVEETSYSADSANHRD